MPTDEQAKRRVRIAVLIAIGVLAIVTLVVWRGGSAGEEGGEEDHPCFASHQGLPCR
jgi:hypothetical protein